MQPKRVEKIGFLGVLALGLYALAGVPGGIGFFLPAVSFSMCSGYVFFGLPGSCHPIGAFSQLDILTKSGPLAHAYLASTVLVLVALGIGMGVCVFGVVVRGAHYGVLRWWSVGVGVLLVWAGIENLLGGYPFGGYLGIDVSASYRTGWVFSEFSVGCLLIGSVILSIRRLATMVRIHEMY